MKEQGRKNPKATLTNLGFSRTTALWNLTRDELIDKTVELGQGVLSDTGALCIKTGEYTGRSPKDKFCVKDELTVDSVDWNNINQPFSPEAFDALQEKVVQHLDSHEDVYVRDVFACADSTYQLNVRLVSETPWASLFADNMFIRPTDEQVENYESEWLILCAPSFYADPKVDGTRQHNFSI